MIAALTGLRPLPRRHPRTVPSDRRWASQIGTTETSTSRTATTLTTGAWLGRVRLVKIQMGRVWTPSAPRSMDASSRERETRTLQRD